MIKIDLKQKIPNHLAFLILISLIFIVSWFTISEGRKIADNAKNSPAFNIPKRVDLNNNPNAN